MTGGQERTICLPLGFHILGHCMIRPSGRAGNEGDSPAAGQARNTYLRKNVRRGACDTTPPSPQVGAQKLAASYQNALQDAVAVRGHGTRLSLLFRGRRGQGCGGSASPGGKAGKRQIGKAADRESGRSRHRETATARAAPLPAPGRPPSDNAPGPRAAARGISSELSRRLTRGRVPRKRKPALRGSAAGEGAGGPEDAAAEAAGPGVPLLKGSALLLLGCLLARCCGALRVSPHVLGHSKAHVGRVVAELVRAAKAQGLQPGPLALSLRGDFVRIGSAYEQHKVRSPDCFDILVPLRLPPHLEPQPRCADGLGPCGAFVCGLRARDGWTRRCRPFAEGFCVELQGRSHLSSGLVLRWFQGHLQRCLGAVRYRLQERCRVSLSACPGQPPTLHILPCSDYVCCHISMAVRLVPAIPLGDALYLTALPPEGPHGSLAPEALWGLNASRQEQRLLGWLKEQAPAASCHLKCLQILKGLRDLRRHGLEEPFCSQWGRALSSYILKTALFSLLLQGPLEAWDEQFLVERLEDLVLYLRDCLRKQVLMDFFLGNTSIPEAVALPRFLKEAAPVNLLSAFDGPTLDLVAFQLISTWVQAPHVIRMYSSPRYWRPVPAPCRHMAEAKREPPGE
ncbi:inositol 1,4,5-trisphosphate receptor-interacting protein-like 2 [Vidua macroura]|uniref:inositol 1,4,5-trisphosphate receptor-interacting protein-like 2 n=1 Tax=Vidua macroura TaxID=187451 RepID=UPI0023A9010D|nr:inositol 1,4,5-trisphosphate receptor-interacting protein-like 2 [Vidua macroura]